MRRVGVLAVIVVVGIGVAGVAGQGGGGRGGAQPLALEKVKDNLYVIHGGTAGNTTVFLTQAGVVLVDTKVANMGEPIMNQVKTVTDKPVSMIINTHSHPDHMGSNNYFAPTVEKVTQENTKKWMAANKQYASDPAIMPTRTFTDKMTIGKGKDQIDLYYFGAGHTDGDAFVVFKELKTLCVGDLMAWNMAPLIDPNAGGSIVALGETFKKAEKGIKNVDIGDRRAWQREYLQRHGGVRRVHARPGRHRARRAQEAADDAAGARGAQEESEVRCLPGHRSAERHRVWRHAGAPRAHQSERGVSGASRRAGYYPLRSGAVDWPREGQRTAPRSARPRGRRPRPRSSRRTAAGSTARCTAGRTAGGEID